MSLFDHDCEVTSPSSKKKCDGCVCDVLKGLQPNTEVEVFFNGMDKYLVFFCFDPKTCCATFKGHDNDPVIIDCREIKAIRIRD